MTTSVSPSMAARPCGEGAPTPRGEEPPPRRRRNPALDRPTPPPWLTPRRNPGDVELVDELIESGATFAAIKVFRHLCRSCVRYTDVGTWNYQATIARATRLGKSTVRVALNWLQANGWIGRSVEPIKGEEREVIWCLWLLPSGRFDDASFDLGRGVYGRPRPTPRLPAARAESGPPGAESGPPGADGCAPAVAQPSAPKNLNGINPFEKTTHDGRSSSSSCSPAAPRGGGGEAGEPAGEAPAIPPPAPLEPRIAELLESEVADESERADLAGLVPLWSATWKVAWVELAIRNALARRHARPDDPIEDLAAFVRGTLERWGRKGRATSQFVKVPAVAPGGNSADRPEAEKRAGLDAEARKKADADSKEATLKLRWDRLAEPEREAIRARVRADNPGLGRWANMLQPLCLAALEARGGCAFDE